MLITNMRLVFSLYLLFSSYGPLNVVEKFFPKLIASLESTYFSEHKSVIESYCFLFILYMAFRVQPFEIFYKFLSYFLWARW